MKIYLLLLLLSFCLSTNVYAQEDDLVFKYLQEKVRRVRMSRVEYIDMTYAKGLIIGKEYRNGPHVERSFYYTQPGKLDSMKWSWEAYGQQYTFRKYYEYNEENRLKETRSFTGVANKMFSLNKYRYSKDGTLDSIIHNSWDYTFWDASLPPAKSVGFSTMIYDTLGRLVRVRNPDIFEAPWLVEYIYDEEARVSVAIEYHQGYVDRFTVVRYKYNNLGLPAKEEHRYYDNTLGEDDRVKYHRTLFKWRYEYYE